MSREADRVLVVITTLSLRQHVGEDPPPRRDPPRDDRAEADDADDADDAEKRLPGADTTIGYNTDV